MCGIVAVMSADPDMLDTGVVLAMQQQMARRGPDDRGIDVLPAQGIALAHTRLSIIDRSAAGRQPLWDETRTIGLVVNGEIYNFRALREELLRRGQRFTSQTDAEVILRGYACWGTDVLHRLSGMFAFTLWDGRHRRLWVARDRLGEKPLYYWHQAATATFACASELHALLRHPAVPREISRDGLASYLAIGYVPSPATMLRGIYKLPAAHQLVVDHGQPPRIERYWRLPSIVARRSPRRTHRTAIRAVVEQAITQRVTSDMPVGAFFSGGVDSSIVVSQMYRATGEPVRTFAAAFAAGARSAKYNVDADAADRASRALPVRHTRCTITSDRHALRAQLLSAVAGMQEPQANPTWLATWCLAERARADGVSVVLTGDGADELFGGYHRYRYDRYVELLRRLPTALRDGLAAAARRCDHPSLRRLARACDKSRTAPHTSQRYLAWWREEPKASQSSMAYLEARIREALAERSDDASPDALAAADTLLWLADESNARTDQMAMAHGLEARAPFLDHAVVEYALAIPLREKTSWTRGKTLLTAAFADALPPVVARRPKWGWWPPVTYWLDGPLREIAHDAAGQLALADMPGLDALRAYSANRTTTMRWALMVLGLWYAGLPQPAASGACAVGALHA